MVIVCRRSGGEKIYNVFDNQLPAALKRLQFDKQLSMENIRKLITEADGYQPHLIAPEQGYRRLIESSLITIKGPAEAAVDAVCDIIISSYFKHGFTDIGSFSSCLGATLFSFFFPPNFQHFYFSSSFRCENARAG